MRFSITGALAVAVMLGLSVGCSGDKNSNGTPDSQDTADTQDTPDTPDTPETDDTQTAGCRSSAECDGTGMQGFGEYCRGPNDGHYCGVQATEECWNNESCEQGPGGACHATFDPCSPDGFGTRCQDACAVDSECQNAGQTDFVCNDDKACVPQRCDQGFACPAYLACDPSSIDPTTGITGVTHGCVFIPCAVDGDCAQGLFCVNHVCQESLGTCTPDLPMG
jgi:hypothetical protein